MFKISRRSLLKSLPAAPLVARQAQAAAEHAVGAGVFSDKSNRLQELMRHGAHPISFDDDNEDDQKERTHATRLLDFIKKSGIPEWKQADLRRTARRTRQLDPDIASLRSVSISGKLKMQWQRNEKIILEREISRREEDLFRWNWLAQAGIKWW